MSETSPTGLKILPEDRKTVLHTCYLMPTEGIWRTLLLPSLLVVLPGGVFIGIQDTSETAIPKLQAIPLSLAGFWIVHAIGMWIHRRNRRWWGELLEFEGKEEYVLKLPVPAGATFGRTVFADFRTDRWGIQRFRQGCESAFLAGGEGFLLLMLLPVGLWMILREPIEIQSFVRGQYAWGAIVAFVSFVLYFPRCNRLLVMPYGLVTQFDMMVGAVPWKIIQKVIWKEPRYDGMQMEIQFVKGNYSFISSQTIGVEPISPVERNALLEVLGKYKTVETRWTKDDEEVESSQTGDHQEAAKSNS